MSVKYVAIVLDTENQTSNGSGSFFFHGCKWGGRSEWEACVGHIKIESSSWKEKKWPEEGEDASVRFSDEVAS